MKLSPPYLVIGSGNMGVPVIASWLKNGIKPEEMVVITGETEGKTSPEITREALKKQGIKEEVLDKLKLIARDEAAEAEIPAAGTVLFATKPQFFDDVKAKLSDAVQNASVLVSIAAGLNCEDLKILTPQAEIIRTMPNLAQRVYGLYAGEEVSPATLNQTDTLMRAMGQKITLKDESDAFDYFTAHAGCGPAFVAAFIQRLAEESPENTSLIQRHLEDLASGKKSARIQPASAANIEILKKSGKKLDEKGMANDALRGRIQQFYDGWKRKITEDLGEADAPDTLNQTILGALAMMEQNSVQPLDFANNVRSGKGITNAGLLCMGIPVPEEDRFGTATQRSRQNIIAETFKKEFSPEESILPALIASYARCKGMQMDSRNPLLLSKAVPTFEKVHDIAKASLAPRPTLLGK